MIGASSRLAGPVQTVIVVWLFATVAYGSDDCTPRSATKATVRQIATNPAEFNGRCVAVDGVMQGFSLFEDVDGVYLEPADSINPSSNGARLGLDNLSKRHTADYQPVSIVGRVQDCEAVRACAHDSAGPGEVVMVLGYCHYSNGAYLWINKLRKRKGSAFERQMGDAARPGYGDLVPAPEAWVHRAKIDALADEFLEALRSADRERLLESHFRNVGLEWPDEEADLIRLVLEDPKSPFLDIRKHPGPLQRQILVERTSLERNEDSDSDDYSAIVCFCRSNDCTGRWPIARFDADNFHTRPYACTTVSSYLDGEEIVPHFTTEVGGSGLAEPKAQ